MTDIEGNINFLKEKLPSSVTLVAVSKTKPVEDILAAYNSGQRCFGENRVQELLSKKDLLPRDIEWHLIGHLQSNKVKQIVPFISMIQSVDTLRLLRIINSEASIINRIVNCLFQIHIATEESKFGFNMNELTEAIESEEFKNMKFIRICGVMGMATYTPDKIKIHKEFAYLAECFKKLKKNYFPGSFNFKEISMGMSGDYEIAIREGSTLIRVGSLIFGERNKIQ